MQRTLLSIILCTLLGLATASAQNAKYEKNWSQVEQLELDGQVRSALEEVSKIQKKSERKGDRIEYLKSLVYRWKFLILVEEAPYDTVLSEMDAEIAQASTAEASILHSIRSRALLQYLKKHQYFLARKEAVSTNEPLTFNDWTAEDFRREIREGYDKSIMNEDALLAIPSEAYETLLTASNISRKFRPTLFDVLALEAISVLTDSEYRYIWSLTGTFMPVDSEIYFSPSSEFVNHRFEHEDSLNRVLLTTRYFQKVERAHLNDANPEPLAHAYLKRLLFMKEVQVDKEATYYPEALEAIQGSSESDEINALINYQLAAHYRSRAYLEALPSTEKLNGNNVKSVSICEETISKYPGTDGARKSALLLRSLRKPELNIKSERYSRSNAVSRLWLEYRNIDSLTLSVLPLAPDAEVLMGTSVMQDSVTKLMKAQRNKIKTFSYALPDLQDYNFHTTEILLPELDNGMYLFHLSNPEMALTDNFVYYFSQVTDMAFTIAEQVDHSIYRFLDRDTGEPLNGVKVALDGFEPDPSFVRYTGRMGEVLVPKTEKKSHRFNVMATVDSDTLVFNSYSGYKRTPRADDEEEEEYNATISLFTDRVVYRPGQTIHFKGFVLKHQGERTEVVPNEYVYVYVESYEYDEIVEMRIKTNEFGSFSGEVALPKTVLTGDYQIYVEEDWDEDSEFWDNTEDIEYGEIRFKVEEYKLPKFDISFEPITGIYRPKDSVTVNGKATSFSGVPLTDAKLEYQVRMWSHPSRKYYDDYFVDEGEGVLASDGTFEITFLCRNGGHSWGIRTVLL